MGRLLENVWIYRTCDFANNRALRKTYQASKDQRKSKQYWHWRAKVLKRDGYKCRGCHSTGYSIKLHAHHIHEWFDYPALRFDVMNGITLCDKCHKKIHPWMK